MQVARLSSYVSFSRFVFHTLSLCFLFFLVGLSFHAMAIDCEYVRGDGNLRTAELQTSNKQWKQLLQGNIVFYFVQEDKLSWLTGKNVVEVKGCLDNAQSNHAVNVELHELIDSHLRHKALLNKNNQLLDNSLQQLMDNYRQLIELNIDHAFYQWSLDQTAMLFSTLIDSLGDNVYSPKLFMPPLFPFYADNRLLSSYVTIIEIQKHILDAHLSDDGLSLFDRSMFELNRAFILPLQRIYIGFVDSLLYRNDGYLSIYDYKKALPHLLYALIVFWLFLYVANRAIHGVSWLQKKLYIASLDLLVRQRLGLILKFIKPNISWLVAAVSYWLNDIFPVFPPLTQWVLTYLLLLYLTYKLLTQIITTSVESCYASTARYVSKTDIIELHAKGRRTAIFLTLLLVVAYYIHEVTQSGVLYWFSLIVFVSAAIISGALFIKPYQAHVIKYIGIQFSSELVERLQATLSEKHLNPQLLCCLILAHVFSCLLKIHQLLLVFERYRSFSAKLLWMRLEQKSQASDNDEDAEEMTDESYEKWFTPDSLLSKNNKLIEANNDCLELLDKTITAWHSNKIDENDCLIIGEKGSGKTSLVQRCLSANQAVEHVFQQNISSKTLGAVEFYSQINAMTGWNINSIERLVETDKSIKKTVLVLDDVHNLFISDVMGFEAYKILLDCINAPLENIYWVIVMNEQSAIYLEDVFGRNQQFSMQLSVPAWRATDIQSLIMSRHKASRRKLVFDELLLSSLGTDDYTANIATENRCFSLLWEQANGNPVAAMAIWCKAAAKKERFTIEIGLPEKPSTQLLNDYSDDMLFIYASLIKHENLTIEEASRSTRLPEAVAKRAFKLGRDTGFLDVDACQRYRVSSLWFLPLKLFLKNKNYLHGK